MARPRISKATSTVDVPAIPASSELIGLRFTLQPIESGELYPQYTIGLHAWFLDQIRQFDPELSAYLHDGESEKPFTITGLNGQFTSHSRQLQLQAKESYEWQLTGLSKPVVKGISTWLRRCLLSHLAIESIVAFPEIKVIVQNVAGTVVFAVAGLIEQVAESRNWERF